MTNTQAAPEILAEGFICTESPRWHDGELYVSDMYGRRVIAVTEAGAVRTVAHVAEVPTGLGWLLDGRLLIATQRGGRVLRLEPDGSLTTHADFSGTATSYLNDMWVDTSGRAYVGELGFEAEALLVEILERESTREAAVAALVAEVRAHHPGRIHLINPDGTHRIVDDRTILPNGMALDADETHLYVNASLDLSVLRFDVARDGTLSGKTQLTSLPFPPDGMSAVDIDGGFWIADPEGHGVIRIDEDGTQTERISTATKCLAVALGGSTGNTLFLCTTVSNDENESIAQVGSRIEIITVGIPAASFD